MMTMFRGEIWLVEFDPVRSGEINKTRPAVIINIDSIGKLPLKIIAPITEWKSKYDQYPWFVKLEPDTQNGLSKISGVDAFQVKSLSISRFKKKIGSVSKPDMEEITNAIAICIGL